MASKLSVLVLAPALILAKIAQSEVSFEWVTVGDPGNPNDRLSSVYNPFGNNIAQPYPLRGAVPYVYSISKYEATVGQYAAFLNAVARSRPDGPYYREKSLIAELGTPGNIIYHVKNIPGGRTSAYLPITGGEAARFVNWLHNGQGNEGTEAGAYTIVQGGTPFGTRPGHEQLTVTVAKGQFGVGTGDHLPGKRVGVSIYYVPEGQYFAGWEGLHDHSR